MATHEVIDRGDAPRVELHVITPEEARRIVDGTPLPDDRWHAQYPLLDELDVLRPLAADTTPDPVFSLMMIRAAGEPGDPDRGMAVGGIGFFGPPDAEGVVEIGYGLVPLVRGRGLASAAVMQVLAIAAEHGVRVVRAATEPTNLASSRVVERAGFRELAPSGGLRQFERVLAT